MYHLGQRAERFNPKLLIVHRMHSVKTEDITSVFIFKKGFTIVYFFIIFYVKVYKMNYSGLLKFNRKWETAVANNQNHFKFTSKAGKEYIVRYQQGYFNVYNMKNDIIADHITTVNDMANCATMITNTK